MKHLAGGPLVHRVMLQSRDESSRDAAGGITESWTTDETFWASVEPVSGAEWQVAEQMASEVTHTVRRRYKAGITPKHRLLHDIRASATDLTSVGTPWKTIGSASQTFTADMVGQYITITAGTNWIQGDYLITAFSSGTGRIDVDSSVAAENVGSGSGFVNRQLEIVSVIDVDEAHVTTEMRCAEKTA
jgi:SPP1 family predicted phage head-tail adaptor